MFEAALFAMWQNDFISISRLDDLPVDDDDTNFSDFATNELNNDYSTFSLIRLQFAFHILLMGQIFSIFVFSVEDLYYRACITPATSTALFSAQGYQ
jgi:hypothetical protein